MWNLQSLVSSVLLNILIIKSLAAPSNQNRVEQAQDWDHTNSDHNFESSAEIELYNDADKQNWPTLEDDFTNVSLKDHPLYQTISQGRASDYYDDVATYEEGEEGQVYDYEGINKYWQAEHQDGSTEDTTEAAIEDPMLPQPGSSTKPRSSRRRSSSGTKSLSRAFQRIIRHHDRNELPPLRINNAFDADEWAQAHHDQERAIRERELRQARHQGVARRIVGSRGSRVLHGGRDAENQ